MPNQARAAANDSQWSFAWGIASKIDDAYAPGIDVSDRPIGERDEAKRIVLGDWDRQGWFAELNPDGISLQNFPLQTALASK